MMKGPQPHWSLAHAVPVALAASVSALGAVVSLVTVASYLGGGWLGYAVALATAAVVFLVVLRFLRGVGQTSHGLPLGGDSEHPKESESNDETNTTGTANFDLLRAPATAVSNLAPGVLRGAFALAKRPARVCARGPHEVGGGEMVWVAMDVAKGDLIDGHLTELGGRDFDWYIVDESNLVSAQSGDEFDYASGGEHVIADKVRWRVRRDGPWYLLLDLFGRSAAREIEVDLRRV